MLQQRCESIVEEIAEAQSLPELKALHCFGQYENNEYGDARFVPDFKAAVARLRSERPKEATMNVGTPEARLAELMAQINALKSGAAAQPPVQPVVRGSKRYRLLKEDVSWSTVPQVHATAAILFANGKVGDVLDEVDIVRMMEANVGVLKTRQGGKKIWNYYKGDHERGLLAHGNIERA